MFKVAIIGGEGMGDYPRFKERCIHFLKEKAKGGIMVYTTGDEFVEAFTERYRIDSRKFSADFQTYGRDALKVRNEEMLQDCDAVICFNDGIKDTKMILKMASEMGLPTRFVK